jgi:hypothetical protein
VRPGSGCGGPGPGRPPSPGPPPATAARSAIPGTAARRLALAWTSPGCTVAGCPRTRIEYDHREDWARTRRTRLDQLDPLCEHHHDLKIRHHWALVAGHGNAP